MNNQLPTSLREFSHLAAFDDTAAARFAALPVEAVLIYLIDLVDEDALPLLAKQFDVLGIKGYAFATTVQQKRDLIKNAIELHRFKGTPWSIKKALERVGYPNAELLEGGGTPNYYDGTHTHNGSITYGDQSHWAYFRVLYNGVNFTNLSAADVDVIRAIVSEYKPAHCTLYALVFYYNNLVSAVTPTDEFNLHISYDATSQVANLYDGLHTYNGAITHRGISDSLVIFDTDADAFISAAGLTNATEQEAINNLVVALKNAGLWTKMHALYPMVGASLNSCKRNLKNPADTNAAFRLNFVGGWTFSASGAQPNGISAYADTFYVPTSANPSGLNNAHMSYYSRTANTASAVDMGAYTRQSGTGAIIDAANFTLNYGNTVYLGLNSANTAAGASKLPTTGLFGISRTTSTDVAYFKRGVVEYTVPIASQLLLNTSIYIGARNDNGTTMYHTNRQCAFASIGTGLTAGEIATFDSIVTAFQTALGRNV
ncbi:MAG: phage tail protein [Betaproteobacteria bacterium]